ncbi:MAG: efflux RND transporter periplasmic adaptor subunit [Arenicellales bacterium]
MLQFNKRVMTAALLLTLAACQEEAPPQKQEVTRPAKLFTVEAPGAAVLRSFPGEVKATDRAELAFRVPGELNQLLATRGMKVKQGDFLASLDPSDYQAALDQARAQYKLAKSQFERLDGLVAKQLISEVDYDIREAEFRVAQSTLDRAQNNLSYTKVHAPFDGVVAQQLADNFESVTAGQVILVMQTGKMLDVIADIPESIIARVERRADDQAPRGVQVRFDSVSAQLFEAVYKEHETQADSATLTYKVTFSLPAPEGINILPGMTATVVADLSGLLEGQSDGFLVPIESVFAAEDVSVNSETRYVWKVDPESMRTQRAEVTVGSLSGDSIAVLSGLNDGDTIIAAGANSVYDNMPVRPLTREAGL